MKVSYDQESDILMIDLEPGGQIDHAEQVDSLIIHFSAEDRPVLLEILQASDFLATLIKASLQPDD